MGSFGGYYKGEKKKQKKGKEAKNFSTAATFQLPKIVGKKKKNTW